MFVSGTYRIFSFNVTTNVLECVCSASPRQTQVEVKIEERADAKLQAYSTLTSKMVRVRLAKDSARGRVFPFH